MTAAVNIADCPKTVGPMSSATVVCVGYKIVSGRIAVLVPPAWSVVVTVTV